MSPFLRWRFTPIFHRRCCRRIQSIKPLLFRVGDDAAVGASQWLFGFEGAARRGPRVAGRHLGTRSTRVDSHFAHNCGDAAAKGGLESEVVVWLCDRFAAFHRGDVQLQQQSVVGNRDDLVGCAGAGLVCCDGLG